MPVEGEYEPSPWAWVRDQEMVAREIGGEERAEWWARAVAAYPPYAEYQEKTTRQIPVFVLEPVSGS